VPLSKNVNAGKKAIVSVLFSEEIGAKNPVLDVFVWDMLNGHNTYNGDAGIDIGKMFVDKTPKKNAIGSAVRFNY